MKTWPYLCGAYMRHTWVFFIFLFLNPILSFASLEAMTTQEAEISNSALKELFQINPVILPLDERDPEKNFAEVISEYLNPGLYTVFDEKTGTSKIHMSHITNTCTTYEYNTIYSLYDCTFVVGYSNDVLVNEFNQINLDMGLLLSAGVFVTYEFKVVPSTNEKQIIEPRYQLY